MNWWNNSWLAVNWQKNAPPFWWTKVVCFAGIMLHNSTRELLESPPSPLQSPRGSPRFAQTLPRNFGAAPGTPLPSTGGGWCFVEVHGEVCTRHALFFGRNPKQKISGFIYIYIHYVVLCVFFLRIFYEQKNSWPIHPCIIMHNIQPILSIHLSFFFCAGSWTKTLPSGSFTARSWWRSELAKTSVQLVAPGRPKWETKYSEIGWWMDGKGWIFWKIVIVT